MNDYAAYGLLIRSALALPELVEASTLNSASAPRPKGNADVLISISPPPDHAAADNASQDQTYATPDSAFIDYPGTAGYLITRGSEITITPTPNADDRLIRLYLLGPILALLLHQRQFLVLHSSAVSINGQTIAFVGEKGMGKSTMAAALHARGHALMADDLVAVDTRITPPLAYPGFPQLKLFPESAALLSGGDPTLLPKVHPALDKRARRTDGPFQADPLPLA
ncbi:MAG TPA: hypothetical protein VFE47_10005, partial [Tepidisphaeraceae bacterium]|nr:hypothetical protein [Tepidisphaeraceae bacterium]